MSNSSTYKDATERLKEAARRAVDQLQRIPDPLTEGREDRVATARDMLIEAVDDVGRMDAHDQQNRIEDLEAEVERLEDALREIANGCSTSRDRLEVAMTALGRAEDGQDG